MRAIIVIALCLAAVVAVPSNPQRIIGGSVTTISQYPSIVSLLYSWNSGTFWQTCSGTILNTRSILTAAHCPAGDAVGRWRVRVGSTFANSGGATLGVANIFIHTGYNARTFDNDIGMIRTSAVIAHGAATAMPAPIAGANYIPADNQPVRTAGWGFTSGGGVPSEQLRQVQLQIFNQEECIQRYHDIGETITDNMLCSAWLDEGNRGQCRGDDGSPLYHNNVVVGIYSWGRGCAHPHFPTVNVRVSRYTVWIHANA